MGGAGPIEKKRKKSERMSGLKKQDITFALSMFRWMDNPSNGFSTKCAPFFVYFWSCFQCDFSR